MTDEAKTKVKDESNEHLYFTVTPRLVWALCEDPDEYTLWCVVKDIAGEKGECFLAREDLATLAMISAGRVSACRDNLIKKKLLNGEFKRDPGYPQAVWHLSIPDFWEANTRWARRYPKIADRVEFKKQQKEALKALKKEASQDDGSKEASQDDRGVSPNDGGMSPGDAKKNLFKNQKEEYELIWELIQGILEPNLKGNNKTFLAGAQPMAFEGGVLTLAVRDEMTRAWLDDHLSAAINRAFPGILTEEATVNFVLAEAE